MASVFQDSTGTYYIRFRVAGTQAKRSLQTDNDREARSAKLRVEDTLRDLKLGRLAFPDNVDPVTFVLGGGRVVQSNTDSAIKLSKLCKKYLEAVPEGAKAKMTVYVEEIHLKHLQRIIGKSKPARTITTDTLQTYVNKRSKEQNNKKRPISSVTIKKELTTFMQVWKFARLSSYVSHDLNRSDVRLPKSRQKPRFHTMDEVQRKISRLDDPKEIEELLNSIYLRGEEVLELLTYIQENARHDWIYPAISIAAFTGARRSEILRAEIDDLDLKRGKLEIREKKRIHDLEFSFRTVDVHDRLKSILQEWLEYHPGGKHLICNAYGRPITIHQATHHFNHTLKGSEWEILKGWHVLRHTFASICASKGIRENVISEWMGHETEEMKTRYRHLFPEDTSSEMAKFC